MQLDLTDLKPEEAALSIGGKEYALKRVTLNTRIWLEKRFKKGELKEIFSEHKLAEISEIAYHLLKDKTDFPTLEVFCESFSSMNEIVALMMALLKTIGISEPVLKNLTDTDQGNVQSPSEQTGAQFST